MLFHFFRYSEYRGFTTLASYPAIATLDVHCLAFASLDYVALITKRPDFRLRVFDYTTGTTIASVNLDKG